MTSLSDSSFSIPAGIIDTETISLDSIFTFGKTTGSFLPVMRSSKSRSVSPDHLAVLRLLVVAPQQVRDRPDERGEVLLVHG